MAPSSVRGLVSPANSSGSFGMPRSSAAMVLVLVAIPSDQCVGLFGRIAVDGAAGEVEEACRLIHFVGNDDGQPVMPERMVDVLLGRHFWETIS